MPNPTSKLNLVINGATTQLDIHDANAVDLTSNQTVAGDKEFTGTTTAHDLIPSATDTYNFGSSNYQWNNAYIKSLTINGVAAGDILTHNASEFVNVSTAQTIGGFKTFSDGFSVNKPSPRLQTKSTTYSSETSSGMTIGDIAFLNKNGAFSAWIVDQLRDDLTTRFCFRVFPRDASAYKGFVFDESCNLYPENSNNALGTSTNKWKLFNGVNPGALSLPSTSTSSVNIDITNWDVTMSNNKLGGFTPPFDGWALLQLNPINADTDIWIIGGVSRTNYKTTVNPLDNSKFIMCYFSVLKGYTYNIYGYNTFPLNSVSIARLYPCQGNV